MAEQTQAPTSRLALERAFDQAYKALAGAVYAEGVNAGKRQAPTLTGITLADVRGASEGISWALGMLEGQEAYKAQFSALTSASAIMSTLEKLLTPRPAAAPPAPSKPANPFARDTYVEPTGPAPAHKSDRDVQADADWFAREITHTSDGSVRFVSNKARQRHCEAYRDACATGMALPTWTPPADEKSPWKVERREALEARIRKHYGVTLPTPDAGDDD